MKCCIQRVKNSSVDINGIVYSEIGKGINILLGIEKGDNEETVDYLSDKISHLRMFEDSSGKMNLNIQEIRGEIIVISQFTLAAEVMKGRRPDFTNAMIPSEAEKLYDRFINKCKSILGDDKVKSGVFGAEMEVHILNDGPVTFILHKKGMI